MGWFGFRWRPAAAGSALLVAMVAAGCGPQLRSPVLPDAAVEQERIKQQELALELFEQRFQRLLNVSGRLRVRGADLCGEGTAPYFGVEWFSLEAFGEGFRSVAERRYGAGDTVRVFAVAAGSPAEAAGVRRGDVLVSVDGRPYSAPRQALEWLASWKDASLPLELRRDGRVRSVVLHGVRACRYRVELVHSDDVNAFADGNRVGITTGMMRFVESDDELALVVGHEIAHNVLGHVRRRQANSLAGALLGALLDIGAAAAGVDTGGAGTRMGMQAGGIAYAKEFEAEADYLGSYLAARAGFDIRGAPLLWRRMAVEHPSSIGHTFMASHPSTPERATALARTVEEIEAKIASGRPLVPERLAGEGSTAVR
ncbi:MAG: hypothetical protein D6760_11255 [Deltaproteobacteria bacterium]|nr:MAG: hypothetical protein D6760_11255 [Deltaproteobacteria bacterium]